MYIWIVRLGLLLVFLSSGMIIVPFFQWQLCQSNAQIDPQGVGFTHCMYYRGNIEIVLLLVGNILTILGFVLRKLNLRRLG